MFDTLHRLFKEWDERLSLQEQEDNKVRLLSHTQQKQPPSSPQSTDSSIGNRLDRNSQNTLNAVLYNNLRHRKQEIPRNFEVDENTGEIKDIDIVSRMTPFTSDKSLLHKLYDATTPTDTITTNWSKTPKSVKFKLVCSFINDQSDMSTETKDTIRNMFRRNFDKCAKFVQIDHNTKKISRIDFDTLVSQ